VSIQPSRGEHEAATLRDLGEFRVLNEEVLPIVGSVLGDDCAVLDIAIGVRQLVVTTDAFDAPDFFPISTLRDFFEGMTSACHHFQLRNSGGNLRQAPRFACHGTVIGTLPLGESALNRRDCARGDAVFVVGDCGLFISTFLNAGKSGILALPPGGKDRLTKPVAQNREMISLRERRLVTSANDNTDGLIGAMWNIPERSGCGLGSCFRRRFSRLNS